MVVKVGFEPTSRTPSTCRSTNWNYYTKFRGGRGHDSDSLVRLAQVRPPVIYFIYSVFLVARSHPPTYIVITIAVTMKMAGRRRFERLRQGFGGQPDPNLHDLFAGQSDSGLLHLHANIRVAKLLMLENGAPGGIQTPDITPIERAF